MGHFPPFLISFMIIKSFSEEMASNHKFYNEEQIQHLAIKALKKKLIITNLYITNIRLMIE